MTSIDYAADLYFANRAWENLKSLQRLGSTECIFWAESHEYAPLGREALSNGHWLLLVTDDTRTIFERLKAKIVKLGCNPQYDNDGKSFSIHRPFADANRVLDDGVLGDGLTPIDINSLTASAYLFKGSKTECLIHLVSAFNERGIESGFAPDYLLPLLGCGYTILTRGSEEPARIERDGEFAGVLMPMRMR